MQNRQSRQDARLASSVNLYLPELYHSLRKFVSIDVVDWHMATRYATRWRLSLADALLDLRVCEETPLAKALATTRRLTYLSGAQLQPDTSHLNFEFLEDLMNVGALPISNNRLAICNPYDDHRGLLSPELTEKEMVVTERSPLYDRLHELCLIDWYSEIEDEEASET